MTGVSEIHRIPNPDDCSAETTHAVRTRTTLALRMHCASLYASAVAEKGLFRDTTIPRGDS